MNKHFVFLFVLVIFTLQSFAQDQIKGKITYEYISGTNIRLMDMWFTQQNYLYQYRPFTDAKEMPQMKNKTFASAEDSIKFVQALGRFNEGLKKMPVQRWYGQLGSSEVVYSSFDNNLKNYCIRDTMAFTAWELTSDTMTFRGVHCQKAKGKFNGMNYTAWFASSIPVSVAPLQFRGLPGLLIQIINHTNNVTISMVDLEWPAQSDQDIKPCSGAPYISKQEMEAIRNTQNANLLKMAENFQKEAQKKGGK